MREMFY
jgi:hypothetical protein